METPYLAALIFFGIACVFSRLGMGGSQVYIPILFWLGMDFKTEAIPLGMLLNIVNSSSAALTYSRKKLVVWWVAFPFAGAMIALAPVGVWLNVQLPVKPLLVVFALFTASAAVLMLSGWKPKHGDLSPKGRVVLGLAAGSGLGLIAGLIERGGGSFVVPLLYITLQDWEQNRQLQPRPLLSPAPAPLALSLTWRQRSSRSGVFGWPVQLPY